MSRTAEQMSRKNELERARYQRNKAVWSPVLAERQRKRRASMTEDQKERVRAQNREARRKDTPVQRMWLAARSRASKRGVSFSIEVSDIVVPSHCPILGVELRHGRVAGTAQENSPSLDRIDPAKGYVKGNIAVISYRANRLKNDGTAKEHEAIAEFMRLRLTR